MADFLEQGLFLGTGRGGPSGWLGCLRLIRGVRLGVERAWVIQLQRQREQAGKTC